MFGKKKKIVFRIFIANFKTTIMKHKKFRGMHHGIHGMKNMAHMKGIHGMKNMAHMKGIHGFKAQSGFDGGAVDYYQAGTQMAVAVFNEGGVNALLAFLAGYNSAG
ncbi:MAG: hypothetical protein CMI29_11130 [Opitutae bacterium]|nr:hypothetical protein [Opitutae bacterium]